MGASRTTAELVEQMKSKVAPRGPGGAKMRTEQEAHKEDTFKETTVDGLLNAAENLAQEAAD